MVVFDTSTIVLTITPEAAPPTDPNTGAPVTKCKARIDFLISTLAKAKTPILIPTPVLSEFLVKAGPKKHEYLETFLESKNFEVGAFDERAAIELAELIDGDSKSGKKLDDKQTKAKVRFDRQVIAIAKVREADCIYTDDENLAKCARENGIRAVMTWDIPLPPEPPNLELPFADHDQPQA